MRGFATGRDCFSVWRGSLLLRIVLGVTSGFLRGGREGGVLSFSHSERDFFDFTVTETGDRSSGRGGRKLRESGNTGDGSTVDSYFLVGMKPSPF